jgi:hypothetical protein
MIAAAGPLTEVAGHDLFFVKDVVRRTEAKTSDKFDVYDAASRSVLLEIREPDIGTFTKLARFHGKHPLTGMGGDAGAPFDYVVSLAGGGPKILRITRGSASFRLGGAAVKFFDGADNPICTMEKILLCLGRKYRFAGLAGGSLFTLEVKRWFAHRSVMVDGKEVAKLTSNWKGEHAEFFKKGFQHAIWFSSDLAKDSHVRPVILALGLSYKRATE